MAAKQARIERRVWDPGSQRFAATGEAMDGEVATLEQLADTLSRRGGENARTRRQHAIDMLDLTRPLNCRAGGFGSITCY